MGGPSHLQPTLSAPPSSAAFGRVLYRRFGNLDRSGPFGDLNQRWFWRIDRVLLFGHGHTFSYP